MPDPLVHVLVINWNGLEHLEACFDTLLANDYDHVRIVLVDNASTDQSIAFVESRFGADPRVEVLALSENLGWSGGNNAGIERALAAGADYIFLINNDTAVAPDVISKLVATAEARPELGAIAPKMLMFDTPEILNSVGLECSIIGSSWDTGIGRLDGPRWDREEDIVGVCGGAMWLRAEAVRKSGMLPEAFEIYLDDLDLSLRIWKAGYHVGSCPSAVVRHKFSATLGIGNRALHKYYLNTRNRFWLMMRHFPASRLFEIVPPVILGELRAVGRALLDREVWRAWAHVRAWGAAIGYIPTARRFRKEETAASGAEAFWPLIRRQPWFCPGLVMPVHGWYPEVEIDHLNLRPFGRSAWTETTAGSLRVHLANRYPQLGALEIRLHADGQELARRRVTTSSEITLELPATRLYFEAERILPAEDTGELMDLGGWVAIVSSQDT